MAHWSEVIIIYLFLNLQIVFYFVAKNFKEKTILENIPFLSKNWEFSFNGHFLHIVHNDFYFICKILHYHYQKRTKMSILVFLLEIRKISQSFETTKLEKKAITCSSK
jgi:hypothetical protein